MDSKNPMMRCPLAVLLLSLLGCVGAAPDGAQDSGDASLQPPNAIRYVGRTRTFVDSIGVNAHFTYPGTPYTRSSKVPYDFINPLLVESGIRNVRGMLSRTPTVVSEHNLLASKGFHFLLKAQGTFPVRDLPDAISAVKDAVRWYEGVNEPNLQDNFGGSTNDWWVDTRNHQRDMYQALKADPRTQGIPVLAPALGYLSDDKIAAAYAKLGDVSAWADLGNVHRYPFGEGSNAAGMGLPSTALAHLDIAQGATPGAPMMATETGYNNLRGARADGQLGVSEQAQGKYLPRLYLEQFLGGVRHTFAYEFFDLNSDGTGYHDHFGLVHSNGTPKPAFTAIKNLISLLSDASTADFTPSALGYGLRGASTVHKLLLQKSAGTYVLCLWNEVPSYVFDGSARNVGHDVDSQEKVTLQVPAGFKSATLYAPNQGTTPLRTVRSPTSFDLEVPDSVVLVELTR